jgi:succinate-acetate transporter protein
MFVLIRRLAGSWRSATRARLMYIAVTTAFCVLAVIAAVQGNAGVAVAAGCVGIVTLGLAVIAPRLSAARQGLGKIDERTKE